MRRPRRLNPLIAVATLLIASRGVVAHPISLSAAIVDITPEKVRATITIMVEDLVLFQEVQPAKNGQFQSAALVAASKQHEKFLLQFFQIRDAQGVPLKGRVVATNRKNLDEKVRPAELMSKTIEYTVEFAVAKHPRFLTITQSFGGKDAPLPAVMDCMVLQSDVLVRTSEQLLAGQPLSVELDWVNPPKAKRNWRELRAAREAQRTKRLGIASFSGLYSFIYIEPREVRHEVLLPLLTLEKWISIRRQDANYLTVAEQRAAHGKIEAFFRREATARVNGKLVAPRLERLDFFGLDIRDFALNAKPRRVSVHQARVGVILSYPSPDSLQRAAIHWKLFSQYAAFLRSSIFERNKNTVVHTFTEDAPLFEWKSSNKPIVRAITAVDAKNTTLDSKRAHLVGGQLLRNIYASFRFRDEGETYDALAQSASGDTLRVIYLQVRKALQMAEQGGAQAEVTNVEFLRGRLLKNEQNSAQLQATWRVHGQVEHWGHVHQRTNEYRATLDLQVDDGHWKISRLRVHDTRRTNSRTSLRK